MALGRSGWGRVDIPHEPGQWMLFQRLPAIELDQRGATGGDLCTDGWLAMTLGERFALCLKWLEACVVGWSYPDPCTSETRAQLDAPTLLWAYLAAVKHNFEAAAAEKEPGSLPSIATLTVSPEPGGPIAGV